MEGLPIEHARNWLKGFEEASLKFKEKLNAERFSVKDGKIVDLEKVEKTVKDPEIIRKDYLKEYVDFLVGKLKGEDFSSLKVVIDAGNGMAGFILPAAAGLGYLWA